MFKICSTCKQNKNLDQYYKIKNNTYHPNCKVCYKEKAKTYNYNKEQRKLSKQIYYENNKEKTSNDNKFWYENNKKRKLHKNKLWRENNKEKLREWRLNNKEIIKNHNLSKYGINLNEYNLLLEKQNYKCAICESYYHNGHGWHVDHCHRTNKIRGILCFNCNSGLGQFKDSELLLQKAIKYLNI